MWGVSWKQGWWRVLTRWSRHHHHQLAVSGRPCWSWGGQNSQRWQRHFRPAGLLDEALRYTGSCCCADEEVGWCCSWYQCHTCQLRGHSMLTATWSPCKSNAFLGLFDVLSEENATQADFMTVGQQLFAALYGQEMGTSMTQLGTICAAANRGSHCASCYCLQWKHTATCSPVDVALKGSWRTGSFRCLHIRVWLENRRWDNLPQVWPLSSEEQGI